MIARLDRLEQLTPRAIRGGTALTAANATAHMKTEAPWTDRTGAARSGVLASDTSSGDEFSILLAHAVKYGIWLELMQAGRFSIVTPTIKWAADELQQFINGLWGKIK